LSVLEVLELNTLYMIIKAPHILKNAKIISVSLLLLMVCCKNHSEASDTQSDLKLQSGFISEVVADSLGEARHIAINSNGDIYVSLSIQKNNGGIVGLRDTNNDGKADIIKYFGSLTGTGIHIYKGYLYLGTDTAVIRYKLAEGELVPDLNYEVIASGFTKESQHGTKSIAFDNEDNLYVSVGAPSNACQTSDRTPGVKGMDPCPLLERYGGIWRFKADVKNQDQVRDGFRYATGIRNAVAVYWNTSVNQLYALQHGRDQLSQLWPEYYTEDDGVNLPAEEFFRVNEGSDFGWPYCYYDQNQSKKLLSPEYGGNGKEVGRCKDKDQPIMAFPGHFAPNDLIFHSGKGVPDKYKNGAFIAFHGSWNRAPQKQEGYLVAFVPFQGNTPSGTWQVFADKFAQEEIIKSPSDAKHRPCGLAEATDGSLLVVDSVTGKLWKISYKG
jgi:glucose/arabinose dehydrogenase